MSGLVSFLLFGAVFFVMMRFGCGAHAGHGGHQGDYHSPDTDASASGIDPVCGMGVAAGSGYAKVDRGVPYRFCSRACLDKFDASPDKYRGKLSAATGQQGHSA